MLLHRLLWLLGVVSLAAWLGPLADYVLSRWRPRRLVDVPDRGTDELPTLSVVVAALNEGDTIEQAMRTLLALDYPDVEIIAVDDRSTDGTGGVLDRLAAAHPRLRVAHVTDLPAGWLGKNHAMDVGSRMASGEYILFTDADVHFCPSALRRALRYAKERGLDHLALFPTVPLEGFWEKAAVAFFGLMFVLATRPWRVPDPRSRAHVGIGAFNLVRAESYRAMGGHTALPMDVADDVKLGKLMKLSGGRSDTVVGGELVSVRWVVGVSGLVEGLTKNMFAGFGYSIANVLAAVGGLFVMAIWPVVGLFFGPEPIRAICATVVVCMVVAGYIARPSRSFPPYLGLFYPVSAAILVYILLRSTVTTLKQGGVVWRGTLYPLDQLRRNVV